MNDRAITPDDLISDKKTITTIIKTVTTTTVTAKKAETPSVEYVQFMRILCLVGL